MNCGRVARGQKSRQNLLRLQTCFLRWHNFLTRIPWARWRHFLWFSESKSWIFSLNFGCSCTCVSFTRYRVKAVQWKQGEERRHSRWNFLSPCWFYASSCQMVCGHCLPKFLYFDLKQKIFRLKKCYKNQYLIRLSNYSPFYNWSDLELFQMHKVWVACA